MTHESFLGSLGTTTFCTLLFLGGCAKPESDVTWALSFDPPALSASAVRVEAAVYAGDCGSTTEVFSLDSLESSNFTKRSLPAGQYSFVGRAYDATCTVVAYGCRTVTLPGEAGAIAIAMAPADPIPECASAYCVAGTCTTSMTGTDAGMDDGGPTFCDPGRVLTTKGCELVGTPHFVFPPATSTVTSNAPTLAWTMSTVADSVRLEVCANRACTAVLRSMDAPGTTFTVPSGTPFATGRVFLRAWAMRGGMLGLDPSPVLEFRTPIANGTRMAAHGVEYDADDDGTAELVISAPTASGTTQVQRFTSGSGYASSSGVAFPAIGTSGRGVALAAAGDVNDDGIGDFLVGAPGTTDLATAPTAAGVVGCFGGGATLAAPIATLSDPAEPSGAFGFSVTSAGDLDRDGYGDVAVGAPKARAGLGSVYVYRGSAQGLLVTSTGTPSMGFVLAPTDSDVGSFGASVTGACDLDADGFGDLAVGATASASGAGRVYVYFGTSAGFRNATSPLVIDAPAGGAFGIVACAGDLTGDGRADLVVGAPSASSGQGRAYVFAGASGSVAVPAATTLSGAAGAQYGTSIVTVRDIDGDGRDEMLVGAPGAKLAELHLGSASGVGGVSQSLGPGDLLATPSNFGISVASPGDIDGDGKPDLVVGDSTYSSSTGRAILFKGGGGTLLGLSLRTYTSSLGNGGRFGLTVR